MKNLISLLALAFSLAVTNAQTNVPPSTPVGFLNSTLGYFTSHNPDLTNTFNGAGEAWTGVDYQNQVNVSSSVGLEYNLIRKSTFNLALESVTRNSGIAGAITSEQAGIKPKWIIQGDTEIGLFIEGGYRPSINGSTLSGLQDPFVAGGLDIKKALTTHSFAGLRAEWDFAFQKGKGFFNASQPVISVLAGFTF